MYVLSFDEVNLSHLSQVGGKNASLGEMIQHLRPLGINIPDGFATTSKAYWRFLEYNQLTQPLTDILSNLDRTHFQNLRQIGLDARSLFDKAQLPEDLRNDILAAHADFKKQFGQDISLAVRSSATAEDLPNASFAGQQETFLNIQGESALLNACVQCFQSLFTDRAIKYREDHGFDHMKVALSIGIQMMVRADKGSSGVLFTLDPDTGFKEVVLINGVWGLGENIVQGSIIPDEFYVFKPTLRQGKTAIIKRQLGSKLQTMIYAEGKDRVRHGSTLNIDTPLAKQEQYVLTDGEVQRLANWSIEIENHYQVPMDIEWAKDGITGELYIVQARPETVHSQQRTTSITTYHLQTTDQPLCRGIGLGNKITTGKARLLERPEQRDLLMKDEILVTEKTNPDWDPILKKAAAIITNQGGRTSHAAIVAREMGAVAIVGTTNATTTIADGQEITVVARPGEDGLVYDGILDYDVQEDEINELPIPSTEAKLILGDPAQAFRLSQLPNSGIGLMRLEFIINHTIGIHPLALKYYDQITDDQVRELIDQMTHHYVNKEQYFVEKLAESVAMIAAAFYPKEVIVRMSDFKSNEYANLLGGHFFEPTEDNPMIGFRGASRYYHPKYQEGFEMECEAMLRVRKEMGFKNIKLMIPFCRTVQEADKVIRIMEEKGLKRGQDQLELYLMIEIPSNVVLGREFAPYFDGFSIGSNDLTQLTLGIDRDSELMSDLFDPRDPAVMSMISSIIKVAKETETKIGLCGQAPSDYPSYAQFLVEEGIDSISFNPDALIDGLRNMKQAEQKLHVHIPVSQ